MDSFLKWLSEQWNLLGVYYSFPKNPREPILLYILLFLGSIGVLFLPQPGPAIVLVCWFAMMVFSVLTVKKPKPPENMGD